MHISVVIRTAAAVLAGVAVLAGLIGCTRTKQQSADSETCTLTFDSFDGGGPEYDVTIADVSVLSYTSERRYAKKNHEELDGAGYEMIFSFKGLRPGRTTVTVVGTSPITDTETTVYTAEVDEALRVTLTPQETPAQGDPLQPVPTLVLYAQDVTVYPYLADSQAVQAFVAQLSSAQADVQMQKTNGGFSGELPWTLPQEDGETDAHSGDIVLADGGRIVLCTETMTGRFTRLASLDGDALEKVLPALDNGGTISLWVEWSE